MEVLDHLKIPQTHLVGISLGTIIIRDLSERYPDRISSLIIGGCRYEIERTRTGPDALGCVVAIHCAVSATLQNSLHGSSCPEESTESRETCLLARRASCIKKSSSVGLPLQQTSIHCSKSFDRKTPAFPPSTSWEARTTCFYPAYESWSPITAWRYCMLFLNADT